MIDGNRPYRGFISRIEPQGYLSAIKDGLNYINFSQLVSAKSRVFIKPNLTYPIFRPGVMTNPQAVEAAILAIQEYTPNIFIGDSDSGGYNRFSMDEVYAETGLSKFAKQYGVQVINLSYCERKEINFSYLGKDFNVALPRLLTDDMDLLVTMPVPKVHANTGVSLTYKNQWGCIPEPNDRLKLHPYFRHVILEVNKAVKSRVAIVDGKFGLNINGPMIGKKIDLGWILVTNDIGTGARLCCELMQIDLRKIDHLRYIQKKGGIPELSQIEINQDLRPFLREKFFLRRKFTDLPGYIAFQHATIAYLAYFSPAADLLHKLLYLIREPLYDYKKYSPPKK